MYSASQPDCQNVILLTGDGELGRTVIDYVGKLGKSVYVIAVQDSISPMIKNKTNNLSTLSSKDISRYFSTSNDEKLLEVELLLKSIKRPVIGHELGKILADNNIIFPMKGRGGMKKWLTKSSQIIISECKGIPSFSHRSY